MVMVVEGITSFALKYEGAGVMNSLHAKRRMVGIVRAYIIATDVLH